MKTTIDLPDPLFRRAKATAATRGISLKTLVTNAIEKDLGQSEVSITEFLKSLPKVDDETLEIIRLRVEEADRDDMTFQEQADRQSS